MTNRFEGRMEVRRRVALDIKKRAFQGLLAYPIVWFIIGFFTDFYQTNFRLFWIFLLLFCVISLFRWYYFRLVKVLPDTNLNKWFKFAPWIVTPQCLIWGFLFSYSLFLQDQTFMLYMAFSAAGIVAGGTNSFAPSRKMSSWFLYSFLFIPIVTCLYLGDWALVILILIYMIYLQRVSNKQQVEYWNSLENEFRLLKISRTDPLTQLDNRRYFDEKLTEHCHLSTRNPEWLTVIIVDGDNFKRINDEYGHDVGDLCIKHMAAKIKNSLNRATDICARFGGEEFSIILPATGEQGAQIVAERIRKCIESNPFYHGNQTLQMTVSVGCVTRKLPQFGSNLPAELFKQADKALYQAKASGRNCCVFYAFDEKNGGYFKIEMDI